MVGCKDDLLVVMPHKGMAGNDSRPGPRRHVIRRAQDNKLSVTCVKHSNILEIREV